MIRAICLCVVLASGLAAAEVAILRPAGEAFAGVDAALTAELPGWTVRRLVGAPSDAALAGFLAAGGTTVVVAMDNQAVDALRRLEQDGRLRLPVVALMALDLGHRLAGSRLICGIAYEAPAWSLVNRFASATGARPRRVLAPHRGSVHGAMLAEDRRQLARQGIVLETVDLEGEAATEAAQLRWLGRNLAPLAAAADLVLVPSDTSLVNPRTLRAWADAVRLSRKPFIAGVGSLVVPGSGFVAWAADPDLAEMGNQAADLASALATGRTAPAAIGLERLLGVREHRDDGLLGRLGFAPSAPESAPESAP